MKDIIQFPIVGTRFSDGGFLVASRLNVGDILILEQEPENSVDKDAIKVLAFGDEHIGYVPNRGLTCRSCWTKFPNEGPYCPNCGASWDFVIQGGLATRLIGSGALDKKFVCYVDEVDSNDKFCPIVAKIIME